MKPRSIEFMGASHPVYWGTNAIHRYSLESVGLDGTGSNALMIKIAIEEGYRKTGKPKTFTLEDIFDGFDELNILDNPEKLEALVQPIYEFLPQGMREGSETGEG